MKNFEYAAPRTESQVLDLLSPEPGRTEILAGGTDVMGLMKKMIVNPDRVVNIMEVPTLQGVEPLSDGAISIGAATTLDVLLDDPYLADYPAITDAIRGMNSMQLQCQGTIGGDLCHRARCWYFRNGHGLLAGAGQAVSAGENRFHAILGNEGPAKFVCGSRIAPAVIALNAKLRVLGPDPDEERFIAAADFFRTPRHDGQRETVLEPDQLLTHIVLPAPAVKSATYEVRHGEGPDYPLAAAAAALELEHGLVRQATVVLGQVAPVPWVSQAAAQRLIGTAIDEDTAAAAGDDAVAQATPLSGNEFKVQLAKVAVKRAILLAAGMETGGF